MKRRALSLVLALVLVLCLLPVTAFAAQMRASSSCISLIKRFEGFSKYPYWDYGQYTVGYGTRCPAEDLERYSAYGISEAEAVALLDEEVSSFAASVSSFAARNGLSLSQTQFDALVSFTYNVGPGWMNQPDALLTRAVLNGAKGNDFIFAMTLWSTAGNQTLIPLVERRLVEANLYLNGEYAAAVPEHYCYVLFDHTTNSYNGEVQTLRVQGYDASMTDEVRLVAVGSSSRFLGWYTAASGGEWVSHLDADHNGSTLYARWQSGNGNVSGGVIQGTPASYIRYTSGTAEALGWPAADAAVRYTIPGRTELRIVADYVDAAGNKWGKLADGRWVDLGHTLPTLTAADASTGIPVTVTGTSINIRSGPGTWYDRLGSVYNGQRLTITEVQTAGGMTWGRFDGGWICLGYTDYAPRTDAVIATGTIIGVSAGLNVRGGPGMDYGIVGSLSGGASVEILEISGAWARVEAGWIFMSYVALDEAEAPDEEAPEEEAPVQPPAEEDVPDRVIATGFVNTGSAQLKIRQGPGTGYPQVGALTKGTRVEILELTDNGGMQWGRIADGWICMSYVKLDAAVEEEPEQPAAAGRKGTVSVKGFVNIRAGAGTSYRQLGALKDGTQITIIQLELVGQTVWGRTEGGWISMDYVRLSAPEANTPAMVNAYNVNVREGAGTAYNKVGTLTMGDMITILEVEMVGATAWGRTEKGWICLDYVL